MISSPFSPQLEPLFQIPSCSVTVLQRSRHFLRIGLDRKPKRVCASAPPHLFAKFSEPALLQKRVVSFAASIAILLWSNPAKAGFLSGFPGIESIPGPQLPSIEFLNRWNEENQKKYSEADARFKESPLLKKLLEQSKLNKEKNKQGILDKYCIRGAEWGVGDCSAEGMSPDEREKFIAMLKQKAGIE
ncbi:hypothetical protein U1Q18_029428 [Sarracenia purpurea var. burkii]